MYNNYISGSLAERGNNGRVSMRGKLFKLNFFIGIALIMSLSILNLSFYSLPAIAVNSTNDNFSVTPDDVFFNWTRGMITVTSYVDNLTVVVNNTITEINPEYFTSSDYSSCGSGGCWPNDSVWGDCFSGGTGSGMELLAENATGTYSVLTYSGVLNSTNTTTFNLTAYQYCPPGLYSGHFYVFEDGTPGEKAKIAANVSIPLNPQNTFNFSIRRASFMGSFDDYDEEDYHSFYFNKSQVENSTGGTVKLTGFAGDIDLFVFDGSSLIYKSIKSSGNEKINFVKWSEVNNDMVEIRVYGNTSSDYDGYVYFTPLKAANSSNPSQEFGDANPVDFGFLDPNQTSSEVVINISNTDDQAADNIGETAEIYHVDTWLNQNQAGTFEFLVPHFAEKVKAKIEWTGGTRYNFSLSDVNGQLFGMSNVKYNNANKTGSAQEEFVIVNPSSINQTNDGYWNITVLNTSAIDGDYNVTAYIWMPESGWFESSFTNGFDFNKSGSSNSSLDVSFNITVPETDLINGSYEGFLLYNNTEGWSLKVPFGFEVKAGMLLLNRGNMSTSTYKIYDNIGFDRLGSGAIALNITYNNTGGYPIYYNTTNSSGLYYNSTNYIDFVIDSLPGDGTKINNGDSGTMDIRILINTSKTKDIQGTYTGNITFNTTEENATSSSYPFKTYVFIMKVVLNDDLTVNITDVTPGMVKDPESPPNITTKVQVKLANGTVISKSGLMYIENFTNVKLIEGNVSKTYELVNLSQGNPGGTCPSGQYYCYVNATLATAAVGGQYKAYVRAQVNTSQLTGGNGKRTLSGVYTTPNTFVVVNDTGIKIYGDPDPGSFYEGVTIVYTITVRNYGNLDADGLQIRFDKIACPVTVSRNSNLENTNCSPSAGNVSATDWKINLPKYSEMCKLSWNLEGDSVEEEESCSNAKVRIITDHSNFGDLTGIAITVKNNFSGTSDPPATTPPATVECDDDSDCSETEICQTGSCVTLSCSGGYVKNHNCYKYANEFSITNYEEKVYILQGSSNSTKATVKNNGYYTRTTKFSVVTNITGMTAEVSPTSYSLGSGKSGVFTINFSISNETEVGFHKITLKAYAGDNESIHKTQDITLAVQPLEETKRMINQTCLDMEDHFNSLASQFSQIPSSSETNYTIANRTYARLLNMFKEINEKIKAGNYMEAYSLMKEANSSIVEFEQQIKQLMGGGITLDLLTMIAIAAVVIVIGGFLAYLLLPAKKGYHPMFGFKPKGKASVTGRLKNLFSHFKKIKHMRRQKSLGEFERQIPVEKEMPSQLPGKKSYMKGYERQEGFGLSYDKKKLKLKKK